MSPRKPKRDVPMLSDAEEAALQAEIANDPDAAEATDEQLAQMRPASEALPPGLYKALTKRGRPKALNKRVLTTLRIDPGVLEAYKATGAGWQSRMHEALAHGAKGLGVKVERYPGKPASWRPARKIRGIGVKPE